MQHENILFNTYLKNLLIIILLDNEIYYCKFQLITDDVFIH